MRSRLWALLGIAVLMGGSATGCSAPAWRDRGHDFAQVFDAALCFGPGMAANVRVTELAQLGFGSFDGDSAGLIDGRLATVREQRDEIGISLLHTYEYRRKSRELLDIRQPHYADPGWDPHPLSWQMESDRDLADVGFGLHVAYFGFSCALKLDELWDALAGCFGADPLHDDAFGRPRNELQRQALSLDAATRDRAFDALLRRGEPLGGYAIYTASEVQPSYQRSAMEAIRREIGAAAPEPPTAPDPMLEPATEPVQEPAAEPAQEPVSEPTPAGNPQQ